MPQFINLYNEGAFMRVENSATGVVSYLNKVNLVIQKDNSTSFFLKNDTYIGYYMFAEVAYPAMANIDALILLLSSWIKNAFDMETNIQDRTVLLECSTSYGKNALYFDELATNGASSTSIGGAVQMILPSSTAGARVVRQTKQYVAYVHGTSLYHIITGVLASNAPWTSTTSRIGIFDDSADVTFGGANTSSAGNGVYFQYSPTGLAIGIRAAGVDTIIPQANWNIDKMNGTGKSQYVLDPALPNTILIEWGVFTGRTFRMGLLYKDMLYYCHEFLATETPVFENHALPARWELSCVDPEPSAVIMEQGKMTAFCKGAGYQRRGRVFSTDTGTQPKVITFAGDTVPIISIRLSPQFCRAKIAAVNVTLFNTMSGGLARWEAVLNGSLSGTSFNAVQSGASLVEASTNESQCTGGTVIASGYISNTDVIRAPLGASDLALTAAITGRPDILTIRVTNMLGSVSVLAAVEWVELD